MITSLKMIIQFSYYLADLLNKIKSLQRNFKNSIDSQICLIKESINLQFLNKLFKLFKQISCKVLNQYESNTYNFS